jgi:hypothetical protein
MKEYQHLLMTAQEQHEHEMAQTRPVLIDKKDMLDLIQRAKKNSSLTALPVDYDPIQSSMDRHPRLSRKTAEEMAKEFGF